MTIYSKAGGAFHQALDVQVVAGGSWRRVLTGYVKNGGTWKQVYTYVPNINTTTSITSVSATTITAPSTTVTIVAKAVASSGGANVPDGTTMQLYNGATLLQTKTTTAGSATFTYAPSTTGVYNLTVKTLLNGYYQPSQVNVTAITANTTTTTTAPTKPTVGYNTGAYTVSGSVTSATGQTPTGTVTLSYYTGSAWVTLGTATLSGGSYTITGTVPTSTGDYTWKAEYGGSTYMSASSTTWSVHTTRAPVTTFSIESSAVGLTNFDMYINPEGCGATQFQVYVNSTLVYSFGEVTAPTYFNYNTMVTGNPNLAADSTYTITVYGRNDYNTYFTDPLALPAHQVDDVIVSGTRHVGSHNLIVNTGHAAIVKSGTKVVVANAIDTDNYRPQDGWGSFFNSGEIVVGTSPTGNGPYKSVAQFSSSTSANSPWYAYMSTNYGADVAANCNVTLAEVYLSRPSSGGSSAARTVQYFMCDEKPRQVSPPTLHGASGNTFEGPAWGVAEYNTFLSSYGNYLYDNTYMSLAFYGVDYSSYYGGTNVKVRLTLSWNFTSTIAVPSTWSYS